MLVSPDLVSTGVSLGRALRIAGLVLLALVIAFPIVWVLFIASDTTFGPAVDDPKDFLITLLNGVTAAALYFIVASGFTLIFGLMRVVNMAHGAFFLLGGYIALELQRDLVPGAGSALGISSAQVSFMNWFLPLLAAGLIVGGVGLLMQQAFLRWNQGQARASSIAISIIAADQMLAHFGGVAKDISWPRTFDKFVDLQVADVQYTFTRLVILGVGLLIGGALWFWLKRTRTGMVIRAGVDDRDMVSALGVNIQLTFAIAFFIGSALAGIGCNGRLVRQPRARGRRALASQLAGGRDHRRHGVAQEPPSGRCCWALQRTSPPPTSRPTTRSTRSSSRSCCWRSCSRYGRSGCSAGPHERARLRSHPLCAKPLGGWRSRTARLQQAMVAAPRSDPDDDPRHRRRQPDLPRPTGDGSLARRRSTASRGSRSATSRRRATRRA